MHLQNQIRRSMAAAFVITLLSGLALPVAAQNQSKYSWVQLRKSVEGKQAEHHQFLTTAWVKSAQYGVSNGDLHGARVLRLAGGGGGASEYDYVTIVYPVRTPSLAQAPREALDARAKAAGYADRTAYVAAMRSTSTAVSQAWNVLRVNLGTAPVGSFVRVAQWEIPEEHRAAVQDYHREYTIPMNAARIKQGSMLGWTVVAPAVVSPDEAGWAEATIVVLKDGERAFEGPQPITEETFKSLAPGKNYAEYIRRSQAINSLRKRVTTRLYEVVAAVGTVPNIGTE